MFIVLNNLHPLPIQNPWPGVLVEGHVQLGTCHDNLGLVGIELQLVAVGIVRNDVEGSLEATDRVGEQVGVIRDTDSSGADGANVEAKVGAVETEQTGVNVNLKMSAGPDMTLPIPLVFLDPSTQLAFQLHVAVSVLVCTSAV